MGMYGGLKQLSREEVDRALRDPAFVDALLEDTDVDTALEFEKHFHALHFGLTGDVDEKAQGPLANAVLGLGGQEVGEDSGYGRPRVLSPDQVAEISRALEAFEDHVLEQRLLGPSETLLGVYNGWAESSIKERQEATAEVLDLLEDAREFYREAAEEKFSVIAFIL